MNFYGKFLQLKKLPTIKNTFLVILYNVQYSFKKTLKIIIEIL